MARIVRLILWIVAIFMLLAATSMVVDFNNITAQLGLVNLTPHGINTVTSDVGGVMFIIGLLLLLYLCNGRKWLWPAIIAVGSLTMLRYMSMVADGWVEDAIPALLIELITLAALFLMAFVFDRNESSSDQLFDGLNARTLSFLHHWVAIVLIIDGLSHVVTLTLMPRETGDPANLVPAMGYGIAYTVLGLWMWLRKSLVAAGIAAALQTTGFLALTFVFNESMVPASVDKLLLIAASTNVPVLILLFCHRQQWRQAIGS